MSVQTRASSPAIAVAQAGFEAWRASRQAAVTGPLGNLALVETRWLPQGTDAEEAKAAEEAQLDGDGRGGHVTVTTVRRTNLHTGEPEHALRLWDADAPAIQHFSSIDTYPFRPDWVVEAAYTPVATDRRVPFEHIRDSGGHRELVVPGDIHVTLDGVDYTLSAFDDDGTLLLVFGDPTNGADTYGAGRFLFVPREGESETVILDFNRAFVPPCGFSAQYNCPLPPRQNRLHLPVHAGEKVPVFRGGYSLS
ncbi:DUF1684 domain-containing protein [Streptomyces sp. GMY02]|uniref:DUF1684 domain-containing protein n=1 Tax=Streptomyces sp. GMY02 TaxID=1333528 RepID=UPI001C2BC78C|nr:DUF1684 domain-containing protein [Streptomyces sp. GMY02]QXE34058.1 DUF1684 domain-containing protein [Streptomyces sp. GMY02]